MSVKEVKDEQVEQEPAVEEAPPLPMGAIAGAPQLPFIHFDWDLQAGGYKATSNVANFEWVILRYARALRDQV
jgi:hypothetical protein